MLPSHVRIARLLYTRKCPYLHDAFFLAEGSTSTIAEQIASVTALTHTVLFAHGMRLNCSQGKAEFMLAFRGPGAEPAKSQVASVGRVSFAAGEQVLFLRQTSVNKHMGTKVTPDCKLGPLLRDGRHLALMLLRWGRNGGRNGGRNVSDIESFHVSSRSTLPMRASSSVLQRSSVAHANR